MRVVRDRRSSLRVEIDGEAVVYADRDVIEGRCVDLGRDGLAIRSTRATRSKNPVTLMLYIDGQSLRVDAVLARRQRLHGDYIMGFAFVHLDAVTRSRIERAMFDRLARSPEAELLLAFAAHVARPPATLPTPGSTEPRAHSGTDDRADRTVVAAAGLIVPVVSGHTQVIAMDRLAPDRTVIAPPPPRTDTVRVGSEPVAFEDSWFEDEMDTAEFYLLEATVEPEPALVPEPDVVPRPERTVIIGSAGLVPAPTPERTVVADSTIPLPAPRPERTAVADSTIPLPAPRPERTVVADSTALVPAPTPEPTVVIGTSAPTPEHTVVTGDRSELPPRAERTWVLATDALEGVPEHIVPAHTPTAAIVLGEPSPPPLLRGEPGVRASSTAEPSPTSTPFVRPSQRALREAMALLRRAASTGDDLAPRRGPRVIVSIPHRTYRRSAAAPWNR